MCLLLVSEDDLFIALIQLLLANQPYDLCIAHNKPQVVSVLKIKEPAICLIDHDLGHGTNEAVQIVDLVQEEKETLPILVFTAHFTEEVYFNYRRFAPASFMHKELSALTLRQALELALMRSSSTNIASPTLTSNDQKKMPTDNLFFRIGNNYRSIPTEQIVYFYADKKMVFAKMLDNEYYPTNVMLKTLETQLAGVFTRSHKSYLINIIHIEAIVPTEDTVLVRGESLPIGNFYRKSFLASVRILR